MILNRGKRVCPWLDELAHGAQKEEPVLEHLLCHLRQLSPVQRDMAVHMLHLAFRAAQELGPEG